MVDCRLSIVPGFFLRDVIHEVTGVEQGNHVKFVLPVVVHTFSWLIAQNTDVVQLFLDAAFNYEFFGSLISGSLYNLLYPCNYWGKNIWCPFTWIAIWCHRWRFLHKFSSGLNMTWGCGLLLDSLWYPPLPPQWVSFCEFLFFLVWCHILLLHRLIFYLLVCFFVGLTIFCQFLRAFFIPVTGGQVHCTLNFTILVHTFLLGPFTSKTFL